MYSNLELGVLKASVTRTIDKTVWGVRLEMRVCELVCVYVLCKQMIHSYTMGTCWKYTFTTSCNPVASKDMPTHRNRWSAHTLGHS